MQIRVENFSGMLPGKAPTLIPPNFSAYSQNTWLYHGDVRGFRNPAVLHTMSNTAAKSVFRIPNSGAAPTNMTDATWIELLDEYTNVIRSPVVNDSYSRYYFFSPSVAPSYNTLARLLAGQSGYVLGVPTPPTAPTVAVTGSSTEAMATRSYVFTWSTSFGEEGAPSPAATVTESEANVWTINWSAPLPAVTDGRDIAYVNLYRTVADGLGGSTFYLVGKLPYTQTTFSDTLADADIAGGTALESTTWTPPPTLIGGVLMANGIFAGFTASSEIWFSEPYRPHAWPAAYSLSVGEDIVGIAPMGLSLVVMTKGHPHIITGVHPSAMSLSKLPLQEPCVSRHSIASAGEGVFYAAQNGLVLVDGGGARLVTSEIFSRQDWAALSPELFMGTRFGTSYMAFVQRGALSGGLVYNGASATGAAIDGSVKDGTVIDGQRFQFIADADQGDNGLLIDSSSPQTIFNSLKFPALVENVIKDAWSGETFLLAGDKVYQWDPVNSEELTPYLWRSKVFQFGARQQLIGAKVFFEVPAWVTIPEPTSATRNTSQTQTFNAASQYLLLRIYADGELILVRELQKTGELVLLPSGRRYNQWQFELQGQVIIQNVQLATSVKELSLV